MPRFSKSAFSLMLFLILLLVSCSRQKPVLSLYYLGHSSVFVEFGGHVTLLCDYGKENAYLEWGWNSPIYDAGEPGPDIITYSHTHDDHYDEKRAEKYDAIKLTGHVDTVIGKISIKSYESSEKDISKYDNFSYLFSYKDVNVLHLGDCQSDIMMINDPAHAWNIDKRYPKGCDILIMPIEGTQKYILQAVKMVELLEPKVLLPTHYWSSEYKQEFIDTIVRIYSDKKKALVVKNINGAKFDYDKKYSENALTVLNLVPSARNNPE